MKNLRRVGAVGLLLTLGCGGEVVSPRGTNPLSDVVVVSQSSMFATASVHGTQVVFVNFDGVTIDDCNNCEDATTNHSSLVRTQFGVPSFTFEAYSGDREYVMDHLRQVYSPYNVSFSARRPATEPYTMVVVSPSRPNIWGWGIAGLDCNNNSQNQIAFSYKTDEQIATYGKDEVWRSVAHELGHSFGLYHSANSDDIMDWASRGTQFAVSPYSWRTGSTDEKTLHCSGTGTDGDLQDEPGLLKQALGPADQPPIGFHDDANCDTSWGWAYDPDHANQAIQVHIYVDEAASPSAKPPIVVTANSPRRDLNADIGDNHGFVLTLPDALKDGRTHTLYAYGIDIGDDHNTFLTGSPKSFRCQPPAPSLPRRPPCYPRPHYNIGDVDDDGWVSEADARLIEKHVVGTAHLDGWTADVNHDSQIDSNDARLVHEYLQNPITFPACARGFRGDVNCDGRRDATDAQQVLRYLAKEIGWGTCAGGFEAAVADMDLDPNNLLSLSIDRGDADAILGCVADPKTCLTY